MQWILVESWYWMLWSHCSYFSALINQFLLDQVLEHFPLQYLCCWMNNQLSEKCIPATALLLSARVHHCVIVWAFINPFSSQTLFLDFPGLWEEYCCCNSRERGGAGLRPCQPLNLAEGWLNLSSDVRSSPSSLHHSIFTETYNTELWCIPSPVHSLSDGKHSPPGLTDPISDSIFMGMSECPIYAAYHLLHSISQSISLFKIGKR